MGPATNAQISSMRGVAVERVQRSSGACHGDDLVDLQSSSTTQVAVIHRHRLHLSSQSHGQEAVIIAHAAPANWGRIPVTKRGSTTLHESQHRAWCYQSLAIMGACTSRGGAAAGVCISRR